MAVIIPCSIPTTPTAEQHYKQQIVASGGLAHTDEQS